MTFGRAGFWGASAEVAMLEKLPNAAMINVKSALDAWWKLASIFSGGMLGLLLLGMFTKVKNPIAAIIGVVAGLLVILWLSLSNIFLDAEALGNQFHAYLTIVFGTAGIFLVGFVAGIILNRSNGGEGR